MLDVVNNMVIPVNAYAKFQKKIIYVAKNVTYAKITAINLLIMKMFIYVGENILVKINVKNADIAEYSLKLDQSKNKKEVKYFMNMFNFNQHKKMVVIYFMVILEYILAEQKDMHAALDVNNVIITVMNFMDIMAYIDAFMER